MNLLTTVRNFIPVFMIMLSCQKSALAQTDYKYPRDDIVVAMAGGLFNFIDNLSGTGYEGYYHNNKTGSICKTPQVTGALPQFGERRKSHYDLLAGTVVQTTVALSFIAEARAAQCEAQTIVVSSACISGDLPVIGPPKDKFLAVWSCSLDMDGFFQLALPVLISFPYPITLPRQYVVNLPSIPSTADISIELSFAKWNGSHWEPLPKPADKQKVWPIFGDLAFPDYLVTDTSKPSDIVFQQGRYIVGKATATHHRIFLKTQSIREALSKSVSLTPYFSNNPYGMVAITIRDSLLAPQRINTPSDERFGLIGGFFPMIVSAAYQPTGSPNRFSISFVIAGVTIELDGNGGSPKIKAGIIVDDLKVFDTATGREVSSRLLQKPFISVAPPTISASGFVGLELSALDIIAEVSSSPKYTIDFGALLKQALNKAIPPIASIQPMIAIGLPQCVHMNDNRFEALSPCVDYGGAKAGFLSKGGGPSPVTLSVDFSKTQIIGSPGEIEIDLEQVCVPRPNTQC